MTAPPPATAPVARTIPVLLYHSVSADPVPVIAPFAVPPSTFARHMDLIVHGGHTVLSVSALAAILADPARPVPARPVVVTFDDGWADVAVHVAPLLCALGLPSTLYVTTGLLSGRSGPGTCLGAPTSAGLHWDQLGDLVAGGMEIGAHSRTHAALDALTTAAARDEVLGSKHELEDHLGLPVRTFAYPHGYHGRRTRQLAVAAGFESAAAVRNSFSATGDDPFGFARLTVRATTRPETIAAWLTGAGAPAPRQRERMRTKMWRTYRRAEQRRRSRTR